MVISRIRSIIKKDPLSIKLPRHIALTLDGMQKWALKNKIPYEEAYKKSFSILKNIIEKQVQLNIPMMSFYVLDEKYDKDHESYDAFMTSLAEFLNELSKSTLINENKIKVSILGKWYNLPGKVVDSIKKSIEETRDYDNYFVNLCINYDGQEEILDAVKLLGMQIKAGKVDPELIDKESIKDNLYSSYFLPPNLMIQNGSEKTTKGFLLWDSMRTKIYFTNQLWPDFDKTEFMDALKEYQKGTS
ncbi:di-trans,poly-cis-decaprenylcistransferase [Candidatus Woesearchaeota archaeon]|nr:di-trans,poly-cis-decaprenylcistransferase [Candidatus Woesearchaeota archaeon]